MGATALVPLASANSVTDKSRSGFEELDDFKLRENLFFYFFSKSLDLEFSEEETEVLDLHPHRNSRI